MDDASLSGQSLHIATMASMREMFSRLDCGLRIHAIIDIGALIFHRGWWQVALPQRHF
jgi:hypothetical protein